MEELIYPENLKNTLLLLIQNNLEKIESTFRIELALRGNKIMFDGEPLTAPLSGEAA